MTYAINISSRPRTIPPPVPHLGRCKEVAGSVGCLEAALAQSSMYSIMTVACFRPALLDGLVEVLD